MATGRLAKILEQEYKTKGIVGGAVSAGGKRLKEIFDVRNFLFSGGGLTSTIGKKIFGKGYSATADRESPVSKISSLDSTLSTESVEILSSIRQDTKISAKNSVVLPKMAMDMNLMKLNIMKLVSLQGGKVAKRPDMFFMRSKQRENEYEKQFGKTNNSPTNLNRPESKDNSAMTGLLGGMALGVLSGLAVAFADKLKPLFDSLSGVLYKVIAGLAALSLAVGALKFAGAKALIPTPRTTPAPTTQPPTGRKSPGTVIPGQKGGDTATRSDGKPKISSKGGGAGSLTIQGQKEAGKKTLAQKLSRLMKSPKAWAKFGAIMAKRGLGWVVGALAFSGPVGWILTAILAIWTLSDITKIIDDLLNDSGDESSSSPTNMKQSQSDMANLIYDSFISAGFTDVQARAAVANAQAESSLDPTAHNTKNGEDSVGLFQMNRNGGLGKGYSVEQLKDPNTNIGLAIAAAKQSKDFVGASTLEQATKAFVTDVERPKDQAGAIEKRTKIAREMSTTSLGTKVSTATASVADESRKLAANGGVTNVNVDNSVRTNNTSSGQGGPIASTYNDDFNKLLTQAMTGA
jgi:hypothetical protein